MNVEQLQATRRLLSHGAAAAAATEVASPGPGAAGQAAEGGTRAAPFSSPDATVITMLSLILFVLVLALVLHAALRGAFRVMWRVCFGQEPPGGEASPESAVQGGGAARRKCVRALPTLVYSARIELAGCGSTECTICLAEFAQGERVRVLPRCNHGFHVRCIDRWLAARQTCPTCRREPFAKPALPTRGEAAAPAAVQLQTHVEAGQPCLN